ncbi:MAG: hypothetical protein V4487_02455 [Chlamydiota bacterium]
MTSMTVNNDNSTNFRTEQPRTTPCTKFLKLVQTTAKIGFWIVKCAEKIIIGTALLTAIPLLIKKSGNQERFDDAIGPLFKFSISGLPDPSRFLPLPPEIKPIEITNHSPLIEILCENRQWKPLLEKGMDQLARCPKGLGLMYDVLKEGPSKIRCLTDPHSGIEDAGVNIETREIWIGSQSLERIPFLIAIELNNLKHGKEFDELSCELEAGEYGVEMERVEYKAHKQVSDLFNECIDNGQLPAEANEFKRNFANESGSSDFSSFGSYLNVQRALGHTRHYEQQRNNRCWGWDIMNLVRKGRRR